MIKNFFSLSIFLFFTVTTFSQQIDLSSSFIPEELTKNANSVVRFENYNIEMSSQRDMTITLKKAITIFNKFGDRYSNITLSHDKRRVVKNVTAYYYDAFGKEIKKVKKKEFDDYSASDGFSLYNDGRYLHYSYTPITYPYTIYYEYEIQTSNTAFIPQWTYVNSYGQSVQKSSFTFRYPLDIKLEKSEKNFEGYKINITEELGLLSYSIQDINAIKYEPYAPRLRDVLPNSKIGVNKFNLEGVDGSADDWQEFGKWYYNNLIKNTLVLPDATKAEIKTLTSSISDPVDKAKFIYEYVQDKVRYISIQVGIGGFKPMLASEVDKLSYGDCKGLTNYTASLLNEVGIKSYHALIYGNPNRKLNIDSEVVSQQGNHMVLYVPLENQDLWLECTSQKTPFADSGDFTDDRDALVISPNGGEIKHTRVYTDKENLQEIIGSYQISNQGGITAEVAIKSSGTQFDNHLGYDGKPKMELDKLYKEYWDNINNMTINKIDIKNNKREGKFEEKVTFKASNYGIQNDERIIFPINAFNVITRSPKRIRNRKLPVEVVRGFYDTDEVIVELPSDYKIESMVEDINFESKFGSYKLSIEILSDNTIKYRRSFQLNKGFYSKELYNDYRNFWKKVVKSDRSKIVLIKI